MFRKKKVYQPPKKILINMDTTGKTIAFTAGVYCLGFVSAKVHDLYVEKKKMDKAYEYLDKAKKKKKSRNSEEFDDELFRL